MNEDKLQIFYDLVNNGCDGLIWRIRDQEYDIDNDEKKMIEDIANYIRKNPAEPQLSATFLELLRLMVTSGDKNLTDFAENLVWIVTKDYYGL